MDNDTFLVDSGPPPVFRPLCARAQTVITLLIIMPSAYLFDSVAFYIRLACTCNMRHLLKLFLPGRVFLARSGASENPLGNEYDMCPVGWLLFGFRDFFVLIKHM